MKRNRIIGILIGFALMPFLLAPAWAQAPFYEGKTITIVIGTSSGAASSPQGSSQITSANTSPENQR